MAQKHIDILNNFDIHSLPDLDTVVMGALEMFEAANLPRIDMGQFNHPLVTGSGNAIATGQIIFGDHDAIFASESDVDEKIKISSVDEVVICSASGSKHAPIIADKAKKAGKHITLITNTKNSETTQKLNGDLTEYVFPKNREPYTYNTSTYMGWILGYTHEDPHEIYNFIEQKVASLSFPDFSQFDKYYLIVPPEFDGTRRLLQVKFIELFGRNLARDVETSENIKHATTVATSNELFISFGEPNTTWGKSENRLNVPLPENASYGVMMAVGYWVISQVQKAQPQYFKDNIEAYCKMISGVFGETIEPIVPGNQIS